MYFFYVMKFTITYQSLVVIMCNVVCALGKTIVFHSLILPLFAFYTHGKSE